VNKFRLTISDTDRFINIPLNIDFDNVGRDDLIDEFENEVVEKVINPVEDFETTRFSNKVWFEPQSIGFTESINLFGQQKTSLTEEFYFFDRSDNISAATVSINNWVADYNYVDNSVFQNFSGITFNDKELYYNANSFSNSFFKLDFYDTPNSETQRLLLTVVIPTQQGRLRSADIGTLLVPQIVNVRRPIFDLDFVGDKEGYFIYWLKEKGYINVDEFYMSAKFFNAKIGQFVRMLNRPQTLTPSKFNFPNNEFYYYKVVLDYNTYEYEVYSMFGNKNRVGTNTQPIKWYEYVNQT